MTAPYAVVLLETEDPVDPPGHVLGRGGRLLAGETPQHRGRHRPVDGDHAGTREDLLGAQPVSHQVQVQLARQHDRPVMAAPGLRSRTALSVALAPGEPDALGGLLGQEAVHRDPPRPAGSCPVIDDHVIISGLRPVYLPENTCGTAC